LKPPNLREFPRLEVKRDSICGSPLLVDREIVLAPDIKRRE
jgi:hypothetical protein